MIKYLLFLLLINIINTTDIAAQGTSIQFENGFYLINGEKIFLKGVGYETSARPGQVPWIHQFDEDYIRLDMERIENAGFNAIRTWSALTEEELQVISDYDIFIIMGIWIDPHGDFSDPDFIEDARNIVEDVLYYSKNFNNIIGYLIMNEPLSETIFEAGYTNTVGLWTELINIIHTEHPGIPVSIANSCNGTYINAATFDLSAYNIYIYNPVTVNHTHGYAAYVEYLSSLRSDDAPLLISEFGLSVSPSGQGSWGYGGNLPDEQTSGNLFMYRALIDGGAGGSFMFNYADGWWKAGNEFVHDDHPEEWFGLISYADVNDKTGSPRPIWQEISEYNTAIITSPKNCGIYTHMVPVEIFVLDTVYSMQIMEGGNVIYNSLCPGNYFTDTLQMGAQLDDHRLLFRFFDSDYNTLKEENISLLVSDSGLILPMLEVNTSIENWNQPGFVNIDIHIENNPVFSHSSNLDYAVYKHQGFLYGVGYAHDLPTSFDQFDHSFSEYITDETPIITFPAGFDMKYGTFTKRIYGEKMLVFEGYLNISEESYGQLESTAIAVYPNPTEKDFRFDLKDERYWGASFVLMDSQGRSIMSGQLMQGKTYNISSLPNGLYWIRISSADHMQVLKLIKI